MTKIYIPVPVSERLPEEETEVISVWNNPHFVAPAILNKNGYWFLCNESCDCDEPDYWLEEREFKNEQEIASFMLVHFLKYLSDEQKKSVINSMIQRTDILPSEEEIENNAFKNRGNYNEQKGAAHLGFKDGANFIINKITGK